jgi:putative SOS response-associated peptidase YedK
MCYRYSLTTLAALAEFNEQLAEAAAGWTPRYNVTLTSRMPVIKRG